jgi:hypothetical protein
MQYYMYYENVTREIKKVKKNTLVKCETQYVTFKM